MSDESKKVENQESQQASDAQPKAPIEVDDASAATAYANFCRVTGTPEELIIDLGLNSQQPGSNPEAIHSEQRVVLSYYTAKRMMHALHLAIQRHEKVFGVVETDVQKRLKGRS